MQNTINKRVKKQFNPNTFSFNGVTDSGDGFGTSVSDVWDSCFAAALMKIYRRTKVQKKIEGEIEGD
jgi:hypothetical protein